MGFLGGSAVKNLPANAGDVDSIPGWGRSSGGGNGNLFQYSGKSHGQRSLVLSQCLALSELSVSAANLMMTYHRSIIELTLEGFPFCVGPHNQPFRATSQSLFWFITLIQ